MFTLGEVVAANKTADAPPEKKDLVALLQNGGVIVIVGGRSTNVTHDMRTDPRLVFWDSTDPKSARKDLPSNTRAVLMTRYISHEMSHRITKEARRRNILCDTRQFETGELRAELQRIVDHQPPKPPRESVDAEIQRLIAATEADHHPVETKPWRPTIDPVVPPTEVDDTPIMETPTPTPTPPSTDAVVSTGRRGRATLQDWVGKYGDLAVVDRTAEAKRLVKLFAMRGRKAELSSVLETMRLMRIAAGGKQRTSPTPKPPPIPTSAPVPPPRLTMAVPGTFEATPPAEPVRNDALLTAIDEAEHYIDDMQAAAKLLGELMPRLKAEIAKFRDRQRRARELFLD